MLQTKEALQSHVNENYNGSIVFTCKSELSKEVDAMVTGLASNASVSLATSRG